MCIKTSKMLKLFFFATVGLFGLVGAWGPIGHNTTAFLAYEMLPISTKLTLQDKYGINTQDEFTSLANWADQIKSRPEWAWSYELHYCDVQSVPLARCYYNSISDCQDGGRCVVSALHNYTMRLVQKGTIDDLRFFVHFMGDIFQPLHVGYASDVGGNSIKLHFNGKKTNLHKVWDDDLINMDIAKYGMDGFLGEIRSRIKKMSGGMLEYEEYANDSLGKICLGSLYYDRNSTIISGDTLQQSYYEDKIGLVLGQLAKSSYFMSLHLSQLLNHWNYSHFLLDFW